MADEHNVESFNRADFSHMGLPMRGPVLGAFFSGPVFTQEPPLLRPHVPAPSSRKRLKVRACASCAESHAACNEERPCERCKKRRPTKVPRRDAGVKPATSFVFDPLQAQLSNYRPQPELLDMYQRRAYEVPQFVGYNGVPGKGIPYAPPLPLYSAPEVPLMPMGVWAPYSVRGSDAAQASRFAPFKGVPRQPLVFTVNYDARSATLELAPSDEVATLRAQVRELFSLAEEELLLTYLRDGDRVIVHDATDLDQLLASAVTKIELFVKRGHLTPVRTDGQTV